ncbi:Hsp20/alpha crystallin family protein [Candidatus Nomurabacteria bacterium]|nr:Hsp20/alpha crystallin family protein [Candidatus Kaiserbacteria bacterium]MCB9815337.1 Hsp20/alpha crystallin family protein [Candidatus Nomurabacteria bacterium]MCB9819560.1 Hsp20/alpha crystallin family protein [Candidatus Nomurabacteria bacterium]
MKKPSFLERLTGGQSEDYDRILDDEHQFGDEDELAVADEETDENWAEEEDAPDTQQDGELPVDMYQTDDTIVIRALVAGVSPADLEISITRDMVTIRGVRDEYQEAHDDGYFHRELFWGSFSRTLLLPEEVAIDEAEAQEKHGLLEIKLPKLDKHRTTQLKVRSNAGHK